MEKDATEYIQEGILRDFLITNRKEIEMKIEEILGEVVHICKKNNVLEVILFGSWAKGSANSSSDIDLAIRGAKDIELLREQIEEIPTLRSFDIVDMDYCNNKLLLEEIEEYGRKIL